MNNEWIRKGTMCAAWRICCGTQSHGTLCGKEFGISKSTVHKDLTERLPKISPQLFKSVKEVLEENKRERHIRGGIATKHKYEQQFKKAVK